MFYHPHSYMDYAWVSNLVSNYVRGTSILNMLGQIRFALTLLFTRISHSDSGFSHDIFFTEYVSYVKQDRRNNDTTAWSSELQYRDMGIKTLCSAVVYVTLVLLALKGASSWQKSTGRGAEWRVLLLTDAWRLCQLHSANLQGMH
jgi:hypothetical protein